MKMLRDPMRIVKWNIAKRHRNIAKYTNERFFGILSVEFLFARRIAVVCKNRVSCARRHPRCCTMLWVCMSAKHLHIRKQLISTLCLYSISGQIDRLKISRGRFDAVFS